MASPDARMFAEALDMALCGGGPSLETRLAGARAHTYARRTRDMLAMIDALDQP